MKWELEKEIKLPTAALGLSTLPHSESLLVSCFDGSVLRVDPRESTWETLGLKAMPQGWFRCWTAPWPSVRDTMVFSNGITWEAARPWLSKRSTISGPGS